MSSQFESLRAALAARYALERELGRGGMATVYLARDLRHGRRVAIKVLRPEIAAALGPERFLREIQIAAQLAHPHILPLHDSGQAGGFLYYVMPYIEGESLRDRLERGGPLPLEEALQITREVASGLSYAHSHDVVHRDIKPENILLSGGEAVVADFGIARAITQAGGTRLTETGIPVGTPAYMSPEQASAGGPIDGRSDVYSLACVLYEMLVGEPPYTGPSAQVVIAKRFTDPVPSVRRLRETIPSGIDAAITTALAKSPADRFRTATEFGDALTPSVATSALPRLSARSTLVAGAITAVVAALVLGVLRWGAGAGPGLDPNLVAIAPFQVFDVKFDLWREGLVDVLSRNLDGAGSLRTVPPTVAVRRWSGRPDRSSVRELARRTGAGFGVFGTLIEAGGDTVRITASILDAATGNLEAEVERSDVAARMDRLTDSLTVALLRELGRTRAVAAVKLSSFGSKSMPALKEFLQGEQFLRRTAFDSAMAHYQRATALDNTFALALRRIYLVAWWLGRLDSLSLASAFRAGTFNRGLTPRESLLVTIDSLFATFLKVGGQGWGGTLMWNAGQRLHATLDEAVRRYPDDPEVWYELGEARYHVGFGAGASVTQAQVLDAFDRAVALDSGFAPALVSHTIECALRQQDVARARRYARAFLALGRDVDYFPVVAFVANRLDGDRPDRRAGDSMLDAMSDGTLSHTLGQLHGWPDTAELEIAVARRLYDRDSSALWSLVWALTYRGHLREALPKTVSPGYNWAWGQLGVAGVVPPDTAGGRFALWLRQSEPWAGLALPWWSARNDTSSLLAFLRRAEAALRAAPRPRGDPLDQLGAWRYFGAAARAYLALAHRDTTDALKGFLMLPDSVCAVCPPLTRLVTARLLGASRKDAEEAALLNRDVRPDAPVVDEPLWALERGRVNERLGKRTKAVAAYRFVAAVWVHADSQLQPYVAEARAALQRLSAAPQR